VDGSEYMEFRPDFRTEVCTGQVKMDGLVVGCIGNNHSFLKPDYPEYADYSGIVDKLYQPEADRDE